MPDAAVTRQSWLAEYRVERTRTLERENEMLRAERVRLERLLGAATAQVASQYDLDVGTVLVALSAACGTNPSRPAFVEHRQRMAWEARGPEWIASVLREIA